MNGWDIFTWVSAVALAASAVLIFAFFLRDAGSILNRDMHGHDDDDEDSSASGATPGKSPPTQPEDLPR